jgi:hypothetical protein
MVIDFVDLIGKKIDIEISGGICHRGMLLDAGLDIIVIFNGISFLYIPTVHIQRLREFNKVDDDSNYYEPSSEKPIETDAISFRKALTVAKGLFVQVYVTGNKSIHGYLTSIMNDYLVFHSPLYKTMYLSMKHVKWLIPYPPNTTPYSLDNGKFSLNPSPTPLSRSFYDQLKRFENQLVILDGGDHSEKIGLLQKILNKHITLITAEGETVYRNLEHIKILQLP